MFRPWVKWLVNHNLKFVVYLTLVLVLPLFLLIYIDDAFKDALAVFNDIKKLQKD